VSGAFTCLTAENNNIEKRGGLVRSIGCELGQPIGRASEYTWILFWQAKAHH
jgi:hypothetical protein